jgi:hypothetical protein
MQWLVKNYTANFNCCSKSKDNGVCNYRSRIGRSPEGQSAVLHDDTQDRELREVFQYPDQDSSNSTRCSGNP